jgi:hypothetical protein
MGEGSPDIKSLGQATEGQGRQLQYCDAFPRRLRQQATQGGVSKDSAGCIRTVVAQTNGLVLSN